ncbi:hypothetical protein D3C75_533040 [compost metagenome]
MAGGYGANAMEEIRLMVNGKPSPTAVQLIDNVSYAPVRAVAEMLDAEVQWEESTRTVHVLSYAYSGEQNGVYKLDRENLSISKVTAAENEYGWNVTAEVRNLGEASVRTAGLTAVFYDSDGKRLGLATGTVYNLAQGQGKTVRFATTDELQGYAVIKFQSEFTS